MHIDRRALLIAGTAVVGGLVIGRAADRRGWWDADIIGGSDPDDAIVRVAIRQEAALIRSYEAALQDPALSAAPNPDRMRDYLQHHVDHLAALEGGPDDVAAAPAPGDVAQGQPEGAEPVFPVLPGDPAALPEYFAAAEQQHLDLTLTGARISTAGGLARLLALISASEATHVAGWTNG